MPDTDERRDATILKLVVITALCLGFLLGVILTAIMALAILYISRMPPHVAPYSIQQSERQ
ncbi:hypothetical protein [Bradyrhizobium sp. HKCCYLS20291]|uniref:hypothetical protein n=1 Tax=Bradyrhizobium sp. HKCCYLS20291 TaxID=3420766 RepID=UPI003EBD8905